MVSLKLSDNAKYILQQRYLMKDEKGDIIETPRQMFRRVAKSIANVEYNYGKTKKEVKKLEREFFDLMVSLKFLPNSPTLMNAGTELGQLSACFVLPVGDSIEEIFQAVQYTSKIHKTGGGTGFSFSRIRPKNDIVKSTGGIASGPISFMTVFDASTEVIKQGGKRRGANMGVLRVDHLDILDFIVSKEKEGMLRNFNISVAITDKFMEAVEKDTDFNLINPRTKRIEKSVRARALWNLLITMSWKNGEPGILFIDRINQYNPTPKLGKIESTNPCGEQPLLPYESCNLGSINVSKFLKNKNKIDWKKLKKVIRLSVRFLDNVIDINNYPLDKIREVTIGNRKIGLGIMGWADLLLNLGIKYNTKKAIHLGEQLMKFILNEGMKMSRELGKEKGSFSNKDKSIYKDEEYMRNATITTIAPTGTISIIVNCSNGIEPIFSIIQTRHTEESLGKDLIEINPAIKKSLELKGLWNSTIEESLKENHCVKCISIPKEMQNVVVTAREINSEWHVRMQAVFQKYTHNAVSKTINLPNEATIDDVERIYLLAYELGCKGITIYRDGSRDYQLITDIKSKCKTCN